MRLYNPFWALYHKFLNLFFDFDIGVYELVHPKLQVTKIENYKNFEEINVHELKPAKQKVKTTKLKPNTFITYLMPSLLEQLKLRDYTKNLFKFIKTYNTNMNFLCIPRKYDVLLNKYPQTNAPVLDFEPKTNKCTYKKIYIERSVKTIEELLELEPYLKKMPKDKILQIPIKKYPIKKEKLTKEQLEIIQTKLAVQEKCKKYSMTIENVYDKFPIGLYENIKLEKDSSVTCNLEKNPPYNCKELQILATGKRKYSTQITKTFIKYSELGL